MTVLHMPQSLDSEHPVHEGALGEWRTRLSTLERERERGEGGERARGGGGGGERRKARACRVRFAASGPAVPERKERQPGRPCFPRSSLAHAIESSREVQGLCAWWGGAGRSMPRFYMKRFQLKMFLAFASQHDIC